MSYFIVTDSTCDLSMEQLKELNVGRAALITNFQDGKVLEDGFSELDAPAFYAGMRNGMVSTTSQVNSATFYDIFHKALTEYDQVLYLGFSSALSGTFQSATLAKSTLGEDDPASTGRIVLIDTLAASLGEGLLVLEACRQRDAGMDLESLRRHLEEVKLRVNHWFTVDDLVYLKRGGRVSSLAATMGTLLNIKPVLHVNNEGKLVPTTKAKGRKKAIQTLIDRYREMRDPSLGSQVLIVHGDCADEAATLKARLVQEFGLEEVAIEPLGMVIGSHAGPGTLGVFFFGKPREEFAQ